MNYVYYTLRQSESQPVVEYILKERFNITSANFKKNENGKPYIEGNPIYFNVTDTKGFKAMVFSENEVGLDCENLSREINYEKFKKYFSLREFEEIKDKKDFLKNWTAKESFVKKRGKSIFEYLNRIEFFNGKIYFDGNEATESCVHFEIDKTILCLCSEDPSYIYEEI